MKYDGKIDIATGMSATSKFWKNKSVNWSHFVDKISKPQVTSETFANYNTASKDDRSKIKDVGGYVGGFLRKGRRKPENVAHKQILTLDLDYAHNDFWEDFMLLFDNAAVIHSTHSHSLKKPRFRLIMPLSREVMPDEYSAISRKVAGMLDIELFDTTTFETNRLMFWPSISKDADYYFNKQDGPWLDADAILSSYLDWTDSTQWPNSRRNKDSVLKLTSKQQNPELKKGVVGLFCRTYTVSDAIEIFLGDVYDRVQEGVYTFLKGSTSGGLKTYKDLFAFSHHGSDPCGGRLCNAFDLVRIHKFGHLDLDEKSQVNSMRSMKELARNDKQVRKLVAKETLLESRYDFAEPVDAAESKKSGGKISDTLKSALADFAEPDEEDTDWAADLEIDGRGNYLANSKNFNLIFKNDLKLKGLFRLNTFDNKRYVFHQPPWRLKGECKWPDTFKNVDYSGIRNYIEVVYGISSPLKIDDALALEFQRQQFNPVRDYLNGLTWDGVERLDSILIDYFGCVDNVYHREAIRKTLVAAVGRIFKPGIKFDLVLTLVGNQGSGKSSFIRKLGRGWSSDSFMTVSGKEAFEQLQGAWIIELAELSGLRKAEVEAIKHFISKQEDIFRPAYQRTQEIFPRQCVFIGTTNNEAFLTDPTGNRRFMPVDLDETLAIKDPFNITEEVIDQIWAEAVVKFRKGERLFLSSEANEMATEEQKNHSMYDERTGIVKQFLDKTLPPKWNNMDMYERRAFIHDPISEISDKFKARKFVCVSEVWCECLQKNKEDMDKYRTRDIVHILKSVGGWEQQKGFKFFPIYGRQKYFKRS